MSTASASRSQLFYPTAPPVWRNLLGDLHDEILNLAPHPPDGTPGIRDWQAPCDVYEPIEIPMDADGYGDCETDGHFLCAEGTSVCALISRQALRRRRDICEEHGVKLIGGDHCPLSESVPSVLAPTATDLQEGT